MVGLVGSISEKGLLDRAYRDPTVVDRTVGEVMDPPAVGRGIGHARRGIRPAQRRCERSGDGPRRAPAGVVTKLDLLEYLAHHGNQGG